MNPVLAVALRVTAPGFWQMFVTEPVDETSPFTVTEHQPSKFLMTSPTSVSPSVLAQPESTSAVCPASFVAAVLEPQERAKSVRNTARAA